MRNIRRLVLIPFLALLIACSPAGTENPPSGPAPDVPVGVATVTPGPANLTLGASATASAFTPDGLPGSAVDGKAETSWNSGDYAEQWIQIELGSATTISRIRLTVAQSPNGETKHQIFAGASATNVQLIHEFSGGTSDGQVLEFIPDEPLVGISTVRVVTTESPSWVAWREIEVLGYDGGPVPTPAPNIETADVIYYNGQILTMERGQSTAQAIAIKGDKIIAVGSEADVMQFNGTGTNLIDLNGLTLTPGFIDSHAHRIGDRWHFGEVSAEEMMAKALSQGWTSIHELFVFDQRLAELENLARTNALPLRVSMYLTMNFDYEYTKWWQAYAPLHQYSPYLQIAGLKITLDREWGEQVFFSQEQYAQMVLDGTQDGWQIATHSFSPKANQIVLNGYESGLRGGDNDDLRLRLEHIGTMTDDQLRQMADLDIIGSVGLVNAGSLVEDASFMKSIPAAEVEHTARWRDLLNADIALIGNTDDPWCCTDWRNGFSNPPNDASVVQAIYQGITRTTFNGRQPEAWQVAQAVTVQEALEMLTIHGAYAAHQEAVIGSLSPGKYADLVILSANPLETPVDQILDLYVVMTMVGGDVKYCTPNHGEVCQAGP